MKQLTETNDRLAEVRKARAAATEMQRALANDPKRSARVTVSLLMPIGHFSAEWQPDNGYGHKALDEVLRAQLADNLAIALTTADSNLRAEERKLCEELVRLAAKTAAGGL